MVWRIVRVTVTTFEGFLAAIMDFGQNEKMHIFAELLA